MVEQLPRGLLADPAVQRAMLLPVARRTFTDPGDDITEELSGLEFAAPGLLYDPMLGMAQTGAMLMGDMPVDPNVMTQTMLDAPLIGGLLGAATGMAPKGAVLGANVFHGGPHRFAAEPDFPHGRPRLDKIGTGEGAQAYGYGFYSADAPGVAKSYADALGGKVLEASDGSILHSSDIPLGMMYASMEMGAAKTIDEAISNLSKSGKFGDEVKYLSELRDKGYQMKPGTLYKLDIPDADVAKYLDYDKPLSEQPKSVEDALRRMANDIAETGDYDRFEHLALAAIRGEHPRGGSTKTITGGDLYTDLTSFGRGNTSQQASMKLKDYGIPGLKYFDADSRNRGRTATVDGTPIKQFNTEDYDLNNLLQKIEQGYSVGDVRKMAEGKRGLAAKFDALEIKITDGTRNYVTWDQDVLDRSKMLERDGVTLGANKAPTAALPGSLDDVGKGSRAASRLPEHLVPLTDDKLEFALPSTKYLVKKIREKAPDAELGLSLSENQVGKSNYLTLTHPNKRNIEIRLSDHATGPNRAFESAAQFSDYVPEGGKPKFGQISRESFDKRIDEVLSYYDDGIELGANKAPTAALPGLLDDTASRMQRARDMGFDVDNPVYHGTPDVRPINEMGFATPSELLLKKPQRGPYFFSKDRPTAATYADDRRAFDYQNAEPEVIKAFIKQENPLVIDAKGATYDGIDADKIIKQFADSPDKETVARQVKKYAAIMNGKVNSDQLAALASRLGRDGVVIKNVRDTYEGKGKPTDVFMVLGAENIRRTTAKFDPAKADSADLLAANPATAALPGLLQDRSGNIDQRGLLRRPPRNQNSFPMRSLLGQRVYTATMPDGSI